MNPYEPRVTRRRRKENGQNDTAIEGNTHAREASGNGRDSRLKKRKLDTFSSRARPRDWEVPSDLDRPLAEGETSGTDSPSRESRQGSPGIGTTDGELEKSQNSTTDGVKTNNIVFSFDLGTNNSVGKYEVIGNDVCAILSIQQ
jgi:hypothetical protein